MQDTIRARVDAALKERFELAAKAQGQSSSHVLRDFMAEFVRRHDEARRRREETLLAIESVEAGRFVEAEEVFAWMETWGAGGGTDAP